ncbi:MAG: aminotransferase class I/II-fold pyridoxal phosphate-dependent enzyme, partial [Undibacterium sp.]|nr:aminotransferase class I/II-fold pyridoxal phosphate-dependent enzyme [Opitutaceae bacterium]
MTPLCSRRDWLRMAGLGALGGIALAGRGRLGAAEVEPPPPEGRHINLAGNENAFGPSPAVVQAIFKAAPLSSRYPFREEYVLKRMLAQREGVAVENIVLGNGCDEILALAAAAQLAKGAELVAAQPTYFQITDYADKLGATVKWVPFTSTMHHDLPAMASAVGVRTKLVYVCNPDNPSGTMRPAAEVEAFCREVAPRAPVFLDEVYLELGEDFAAQTQVPLVRAGLPVIIGRSFSKMHGLAGHRIGYAVTTPKLADALSRMQMSSVNYIGVAAARAALLDREFPAWSRRKIAAGREKLAGLLGELGLKFTPSHGNFIFHRTGRP